LRDPFTCMAVDLPGLGRTPKGRYEDGSSLNQLGVVTDQIEKPSMGSPSGTSWGTMRDRTRTKNSGGSSI
jgi:hypothetical protein